MSLSANPSERIHTSVIIIKCTRTHYSRQIASFNVKLLCAAILLAATAATTELSRTIEMKHTLTIYT